tara:strand:+ start:677 stop:925 length:249 start_codon:yes stop_codon:yes gene_type:complete
MSVKKKDIENFLIKKIFGKKIPKNYLSINIVKTNEIDSLKMFKLIIEIETKFKIKLTDKEIFSNKFKNISGILKIILRKIEK